MLITARWWLCYEAGTPSSAALCCLLAFLAALAAAAFAFFASAFAAYRKPISNETNNQRKRKEYTFSSSSFFFASSSAFFFSSSSCAFEGAAGAPPLFFFFASLASFSSCLIRLIRGSRLSVKSTSVRRRAVSSFFLLARSVLFFFSVYRLSSRLHNPSDQSEKWRGERGKGRTCHYPRWLLYRGIRNSSNYQSCTKNRKSPPLALSHLHKRQA